MGSGIDVTFAFRNDTSSGNDLVPMRTMESRLERGNGARARSLIAAAVVLFAATSGIAIAQRAETDSPRTAILRIRHIDVGQGDAALLTTPEGRRILIDAGPSIDAVARILRSEGVDTLDLVVASHNHADHIGESPRLFRRLS